LWPDGKERLLDHPLTLVNTKAKRLKSLFARQRPFRNEQVPWIGSMVFLSHPDLDCRLTLASGPARCTTSRPSADATTRNDCCLNAPQPSLVPSCRTRPSQRRP